MKNLYIIHVHTLSYHHHQQQHKQLYEHPGADVFGKRRRLGEILRLEKAMKFGCSSLDKRLVEHQYIE